jgi:hypothetical protein
MLLGQGIFAIGCLSLVTVTPDTAFTYMWWQLLLIGAGIGLVVPPMTSAVLGAILPNSQELPPALSTPLARRAASLA